MPACRLLLTVVVKWPQRNTAKGFFACSAIRLGIAAVTDGQQKDALLSRMVGTGQAVDLSSIVLKVQIESKPLMIGGKQTVEGGQIAGLKRPYDKAGMAVHFSLTWPMLLDFLHPAQSRSSYPGMGYE